MIRLTHTQEHLAQLVAGTIHTQRISDAVLLHYEHLLRLLEKRDPDARAELEAAVAERVRALQGGGKLV